MRVGLGSECRVLRIGRGILLRDGDPSTSFCCSYRTSGSNVVS